MSSPDKCSIQPNKVDYTDSGGFPSNPNTVNYDYTTGNYNKTTEPDSNYEKTNYGITNFPKTDYIKFNSNTTNYNPVPVTNNTVIDADLPLVNLSSSIPAPFNTATCQSPDMLYQAPRDPQYKSVEKYMCFNNYNKLLEITKQDGKWSANDLTYSNLHVKWNGSQCKITTPDICNRDKLSDNCEATCFISQNEAVNIKYQNNIWHVPKLEEEAGACTKTAISENTAQNSYCKCDNNLDKSILQTKALMDKNRGGKFWCSS